MARVSEVPRTMLRVLVPPSLTVAGAKRSSRFSSHGCIHPGWWRIVTCLRDANQERISFLTERRGCIMPRILRRGEIVHQQRGERTVDQLKKPTTLSATLEVGRSAKN